MSRRRAWVAYAVAHPPAAIIVYAERRGQARARGAREARRVGWYGSSFVELGAVRAPELDRWEVKEAMAATFLEQHAAAARIAHGVEKRRREGWRGCIPPANFLAPAP